MKKTFFTLFMIGFTCISICNAQTIYKIRDARKNNAGGSPLDSGYIAHFKGIVSTYDLGTGTAGEFFMYDSTGSVCVYAKSTQGYFPNMGDSISLHGVVGIYYGLTEIENDSITYISSGHPVTPPVTLTTNLTEANEGMIVKYTNMTLLTGKWGASGAAKYFTTLATNGPDTIDIYIGKADSCFTLPTPGTDTFDIIGAVEQHASASPPFIGGYQIVPRRVEDIQIKSTKTGIANAHNLVSGLEIYPVPASEELTVRADENITSVSIYDITGKLMLQKLNTGNNTSINIRSLNAGLYLVRTESGNNTQVSKIVKN